MTGRLAGQTINDRLLAAKHSLAGQGLAKSVCKATTEELIGPKKKHLDYSYSGDNTTISTGRFLLLSKAIQDLFPTENIGTYFTPYQAGNETNVKRCARGKLYDKYNNIRRAFRSVGLIPKKRKFYDSSNESTESDNQEDCESVSWLEHCIEPWTDVCQKWDQTFSYRKKLLKTDIEPQDYFNTFPALKQPLGYSLIEADFKKKCKEYENKLFFNLPDLINSILLKARASLDQNIKKILEENEPCENEDLVHCTNEPNVSIPQLANLLIERSQNTNWIVVYKALVTVHHMMCYGNERFTQFLASSNSTFQLSNFLDKGGVQGYDMSPFIRRYARYLNEKALSYRTVAFDFCKVKRGKDDGMLRTMNADKLLKTVPVLQNQLDALLEFNCSADDLTNGVVNMSFMLLFRDLIRLFACYNDGIINLLEKFFDMNKKQCRDALDIYKKFLVRMDKVAEFLKVAENVGIDKGDIPDLTKAPSSLLDALEQHLNHMEGKKSSSSTSSQSSSSSSHQKNVKSGVTALSSTSNAFGNVAANARFDTPPNGIDENLKSQILAEEEAAINQFKSKISPSAANNPFLSNSSSSLTVSSQSGNVTTPTVDLFASDPVPSPIKASDDLLQLSNPFADAFSQPSPVANIPSGFISPQPNNIWMANGNGFGVVSPVTSPVITNGAFVSEKSFASVFGNTESKVSNFDALGGLLQPVNSSGHKIYTSTNSPSNNNVNNNQQTANNGLLTGDLESSLASLAENLSINNRVVPPKNVQWNSPKNGSKTGTSWTPQPISDTTGAGYKPMNQSMQTSPFSSMTVTSPQPSIYPPILGIRPLPPNHTIMSPMPAMSQVNSTPNQMGQSLLFH